MGRKFDPSLIPASPDLSLELPLWKAGIQTIAGIDEAGRGALAGPVAAAALIFPSNPNLTLILAGVRDSKELTSTQRNVCAKELRKVALAWGVGFATPLEIDELGIVPATRLAAQRALDGLSVSPQHLLLDYLFLIDNTLPQTALTKGDARSLSIAGASILAKTTRDNIMCELDRQNPGYGFAVHKGYGTAAHLTALKQLGPCAIHRHSFRPIRV